MIVRTLDHDNDNNYKIITQSYTMDIPTQLSAAKFYFFLFIPVFSQKK